MAKCIICNSNHKKDKECSMCRRPLCDKCKDKKVDDVFIVSVCVICGRMICPECMVYNRDAVRVTCPECDYIDFIKPEDRG